MTFNLTPVFLAVEGSEKEIIKENQFICWNMNFKISFDGR